MFVRLVQECRLALEGETEVYTGGKKKRFFTGTGEKYKSATPEVFKWASGRKNTSDDLKIHAPQRRKTVSGKQEKGPS